MSTLPDFSKLDFDSIQTGKGSRAEWEKLAQSAAAG